jgi:hypothetical protein
MHPAKQKAISVKRIAKHEGLSYHEAVPRYEMLKSTNELEAYMTALDADIQKPKEEIIYCDDCNKQMVLKAGKNGWFYGCSNFPDCRVTKSIDTEPVKNEPIDMSQIEKSQRCLQKAISYIQDVGSLANAKKFLSLAEKLTEL